MAFRIRHNDGKQWYAGGAWSDNPNGAYLYTNRESAQRVIEQYSMPAVVEHEQPPPAPQQQERSSHPSQPEGQDDNAGGVESSDTESDDSEA